MPGLAANAADLSTLADCQAYVVDASVEGKDVLQALLTGASLAIARYLSRDVVAKTYQEQRNGTGSSALVLRQSPLNEVTSVTIDGQPVLARATPRDGGWVVDLPAEADRLATLVRDGGIWPKGIQNVIVSYTAGYVTPGQVELDATDTLVVSLPLDLDIACRMLVGHLYKERTRIGEVSKNLAGAVVSYSQARIPPKVAAWLDPWRRAALP